MTLAYKESHTGKKTYDIFSTYTEIVYGVCVFFFVLRFLSVEISICVNIFFPVISSAKTFVLIDDAHNNNFLCRRCVPMFDYLFFVRLLI